jgi:(E)-4-hydroxy-3-methylbut-2-enyl-diphosphate synthase
MNELEQRLEDIIEPLTISVIGCVVNGPGEALISDLGVAGANRKSGFYLNGQRQKLRLDNNNIAEQLEQQVRQYLVAREQLIGIKQLD